MEKYNFSGAIAPPREWKKEMEILKKWKMWKKVHNMNKRAHKIKREMRKYEEGKLCKICSFCMLSGGRVKGISFIFISFIFLNCVLLFFLFQPIYSE